MLQNVVSHDSTEMRARVRCKAVAVVLLTPGATGVWPGFCATADESSIPRNLTLPPFSPPFGCSFCVFRQLRPQLMHWLIHC